METVEPVKKKHHKGEKRRNPNEHTLCWDCKNATNNGCPWSDHAEPVPGWEARKTKIKFSGEKTDSYHVYSCPLFKRDAENGGACPVWGWKNKDDKGDGNGKHSASYALYRMAFVPDTRDLGSSVRHLANSEDGRAWVLKKPEYLGDILDIGYGIIERAVYDWQTLEYGLSREAFIDGREFIKREEVVSFFFSKWFTRLCEPLHYSPEEIRDALNIPEDAMRILFLKDEERIREVFERRADS